VTMDMKQQSSMGSYNHNAMRISKSTIPPIHSSNPGKHNQSAVIRQLVSSSLAHLCHTSLTFNEHIRISGELKFNIDSQKSHTILIDENVRAVQDHTRFNDNLYASLNDRDLIKISTHDDDEDDDNGDVDDDNGDVDDDNGDVDDSAAIVLTKCKKSQSRKKLPFKCKYAMRYLIGRLNGNCT